MTITEALTEFLTVSVAILKLAFLPSVAVYILFKFPKVEKVACKVFGFNIGE